MIENRKQPSFAIAHDREPLPEALQGAVVAIGNFDGVHRGHRAVIAAALSRAKALGRPAAALTFEPHPRSFFSPHQPLFRLTDERAKLRLFAATGLSGAIVLTFDAELAEPDAESFVNDILLHRLGISGAAVGFDFRFGRNRTGNPELLAAEGRRRNFAVDVVGEVDLDGERISSGVIRKALAAGRVAEANALLGYPWFVSGEVVHGDKRGRELGYPTANLRLDPACGLRHGIYAVRVGLGDRHCDGVASFGRRPMFDVGTVLLEVFLFDFAGDLYGQTIDVAFIGWIRHELAFATVEELVRRMGDDSARARMMLSRDPKAFPPLGELPPHAPG
ncbi:MAG TPA: bifunctional riboflavin kinase/FAD synthetase [Xanthobacteraceae bacterium]|nr:bifunctional riboflavin kinase/FAD synthetase [Xanthobacteraceae bacterium]